MCGCDVDVCVLCVGVRCVALHVQVGVGVRGAPCVPLMLSAGSVAGHTSGCIWHCQHGPALPTSARFVAHTRAGLQSNLETWTPSFLIVLTDCHLPRRRGSGQGGADRSAQPPVCHGPLWPQLGTGQRGATMLMHSQESWPGSSKRKGGVPSSGRGRGPPAGYVGWAVCVEWMLLHPAQ